MFGSEPQFAQGTKSSQFQTQFNTAFTITATFEQETDLSVLHIATALTTAYITASSRTPHNWRLKSARTLAPASFVHKGRWIYLVYARDSTSNVPTATVPQSYFSSFDHCHHQPYHLHPGCSTLVTSADHRAQRLGRWRKRG